jgi:hypothetical protein
MNNEETFQNYMTKTNPNWQQLPMDTIQQAKELYDLEKYYEDRATTLLKRQFSSSAGIDYTNDYEKTNAELAKTRARLDNLIKPLEKTNEMINSNVRSM